MSAKELITYPMLSNVNEMNSSCESSMTVRDCPVSVRGVQEEVCDGTLVNVEETTRFVPDAAAAKAYCMSSYVGPSVTAMQKEFFDKYASASRYSLDQAKAEFKYGEGERVGNNFSAYRSTRC